jgi:hypothetical protein
MQTMMRGKTHHKRALVQNECSGIRRFYCQSLPLLIVEIWQRNDVSDINLPSLLIPAPEAFAPHQWIAASKTRMKPRISCRLAPPRRATSSDDTGKLG